MLNTQYYIVSYRKFIAVILWRLRNNVCCSVGVSGCWLFIIKLCLRYNAEP